MSAEKQKRAVKHFTDLEVWRSSHQLFLDLVEDLDPLPQKRSVAILTDQILRSVGSVGANISEGFNRSKKKYLNSLDIAWAKRTKPRTGYTNSATPSSWNTRPGTRESARS